MIGNFETIIGIEIHIELNTKTKAFSAVKNDFLEMPNKLISPTDLGYPGSLPILNKEVVIKAIQLAKALKMEIDNELHFDRKNYYYTDLPKGFQITQQFRPIGKNGTLNIELSSYNKNIRIERIHIEEDTARQQHYENETWINYNRAGVPLIEIVSMSDIRNKEEAIEYVDSIRKIVSFLNISDAKMSEGSLRADINISTRLLGSNKFGTKVEIKNLNSLNNIKKAIEYESNLQIQKILKNEVIKQETKRFDEETNSTISMREKTDSVDYRYFPEPNIPIVKLEQDFINSIAINELPHEMKIRYQKMNISNEFIEQLINNKEYANFIDSIQLENKEEVVKLFFAEIVPLEKKQNISLSNLNIKPFDFQSLIETMQKGIISGKQLKLIVPKLINLKQNVDDLLEDMQIKLISDPKIISNWINQIINQNKDLIQNYIERKERTTKFIIGEIMKLSKGQANPVLTNELIEKIIGEEIEKK